MRKKEGTSIGLGSIADGMVMISCTVFHVFFRDNREEKTGSGDFRFAFIWLSGWSEGIHASCSFHFSPANERHLHWFWTFGPRCIKIANHSLETSIVG